MPNRSHLLTSCIASRFHGWEILTRYTAILVARARTWIRKFSIMHTQAFGTLVFIHAHVLMRVRRRAEWLSNIICWPKINR
jgi:hypothetical protein